jgi:hypothetical protein
VSRCLKSLGCASGAAQLGGTAEDAGHRHRDANPTPSRAHRVLARPAALSRTPIGPQNTWLIARITDNASLV